MSETRRNGDHDTGAAARVDESSISVHEALFEKLLQECVRRGAVEDDVFVNDLATAFRQLLDACLERKRYDKINGLINRVSMDPSINHKDELCRVCGNLFYENDFPVHSLDYYRQSCVLNPFNLLALESYENLLNSFIERWHYRMINDRTRNSAYSKVISKKLATGLPLRILDIGFGCGVLSAQCLYSNQSNVPTVYACEQSEVFHQIAQKLLRSEASEPYARHVSLINKHSNELSIEADLNGRQVDVIVTEIFDDGLLGENSLETFYNAIFKNQVIKQDAASKRFNIIPQYARLYICAIESETIRKANFYKFSHLNQEINVLSFSDCENFQNSERFEPYTTESLDRIEWKLLAEPQEIDKFKINFDNYDLLKELCEHETVLKTHCKLKFVEDGHVDAYVVWFDLYLDDETHITNSPFDLSAETRATCWHQAIYPTYDRVGKVSANQSLVIEVSLKKDCLLVNKLNCEDLQAFNVDVSITNVYASQLEICSLHDASLQNFYLDCFNEIKNSRQAGGLVTRVGMYCSCVNVLLLEFLGGKYEAMENIELVVFASDSQNDYFSEFIQGQKLTRKIKFIDLRSVLDENQQIQKIDYLIYEPTDLTLGVLRKNLFSTIILIRDLLLKNENNMFPSKISVSGMFIESDELINESTLISNDLLCVNKVERYNLKDVLRNYAISHQYAINKTELKAFKTLTSPTSVFQIDVRQRDFEKEFKKKSLEFRINEAGKLTAFLYWSVFEANFNTATTIHFDSLSSFTHYSQNIAGVIMYNNFETKPNQTVVKADALLKHDIFYLKIEEIF